MEDLRPATERFPWPTIAMSAEKLVALTNSLMDAGVRYELGSKVEPLGKQAGEFGSVDCSGFVRWAVYHATGQRLLIPDGSVDQHEWVEKTGFKRSSFEAARLTDGAIRIACLAPEIGGGIGHVALITGGKTCESHGHKGVDRREWGSEPFMRNCAIYALTAPDDAEPKAQSA